ncbi:hypothetical protein TNCT_256761, partial [Trichonephila clavata]
SRDNSNLKDSRTTLLDNSNLKDSRDNSNLKDCMGRPKRNQKVFWRHTYANVMRDSNVN